MNKYKEAKAWLDKINANPHWNRVDIEEPALSQLTELVEKATPKKLKEDEYLNLYGIKSCPRCGGYIHIWDGHNGYLFCHHCGQALDWGE